MLRSEMIRAVSNIQAAITLSNLVELLVGWAAGHGRTDAPMNPIGMYRDWVLAANEFGETEKQILKIFRINALLDTNFWNSVLLSKSTSVPERQGNDTTTTVRRLWTRTSLLENELPQIIELLRRDSDPPVMSREEGDEAGGPITTFPVITIILKEDNNQNSSPQRIVSAIESISIIYSVFADMGNISGNDLVVIGCDSGSDKSFDFTGGGSSRCPRLVNM